MTVHDNLFPFRNTSFRAETTGRYLISNVLHYLAEDRPNITIRYSDTDDTGYAFAKVILSERSVLRFVSSTDPRSYGQRHLHVDQWGLEPVAAAIQSLARKEQNLDLVIGKQRESNINDVVIVLNALRATDSQYMFVASVIPSLFPEIFKNKAPLTSEELKVLEALGKGDDSLLVSAVRDRHRREFQELLEDELGKRLRSNILKNLDRSRGILQRAERVYQEATEALYRLGDDLAAKRLEADNWQKQYEASLASLDMTTLIDFADSMGVELAFRDDSLHITCATIATNYEEDVAETYITSPNSELFSNEPQREFLRKLYKAVFVDKRYYLRVKQGFIIQNDNQPTHDGSDMTDYLADHAIANPHITFFNCFGTGRSARLSAHMTNNDWEGYIAELVAVTGGLTFSDITVMHAFNEIILQVSDRKIFEDKEGTLWSANEIVQREA